MKSFCVASLSMMLMAFASAQANTEVGAGPTAAGQSIADALMSASGADAAFVAAGLLKRSSGSLTEVLNYPTDTLAVVKLSGAELKSALERSVALSPSANPAFLDVAGLTITFNPAAPSEARIRSVSVGGSPLDPRGSYRVAMPSNLARGGLGYFLNWDASAIEVNVRAVNLVDILRGRTSENSAPRWTSVTN